MEEFKDKTDDDLEKMREESASNSYVPSSIFHRIERELERRHRKRLEDSARVPVNVGILSQGANATFKGNVFNQGFSSDKNPFWKKPEIVIPVIVTIAIAIIGWVYFTPKAAPTISVTSSPCSINTLGESSSTNIIHCDPTKDGIQNTETFSIDVGVPNNGSYTEVLQYAPIPSSIDIKWGYLHLNAQSYSVSGKVLTIYPSKIQESNPSEQQDPPWYFDPTVVSYTYLE